MKKKQKNIAIIGLVLIALVLAIYFIPTDTFAFLGGTKRLHYPNIIEEGHKFNVYISGARFTVSDDYGEALLFIDGQRTGKTKQLEDINFTVDGLSEGEHTLYAIYYVVDYEQSYRIPDNCLKTQKAVEEWLEGNWTSKPFSTRERIYTIGDQIDCYHKDVQPIQGKNPKVWERTIKVSDLSSIICCKTMLDAEAIYEWSTKRNCQNANKESVIVSDSYCEEITELDCKDSGCPIGYDCYEDKGVCIRTEIKVYDEEDIETDITIKDGEEGIIIQEDETPYGMYALGIMALIALGLAYWKWGKKPRKKIKLY